MTNDNSTNSQLQLTRFIAVLFFITTCVLLFRGCGTEATMGTASDTYEKKLQQLDYDIYQAKIENEILSKLVMNDNAEKDSIILATKNELAAYKDKTRKEKNKQFNERFASHKPVLEETPTIDSNTVDTINKYSIDCEGKKAELVKANSVIGHQKEIIRNDSSIIADTEGKFKTADTEARKQYAEAKYQKYAKNFFIGLSVSLAVFHAVLITTIISK